MVEEQTSETQENEVTEAVVGSALNKIASAIEDVAGAAIGGVQGTGGNMTAGAEGKQPPANSDGETPVGDEPITNRFVGLPIQSLICGPIIAAAKGQQELTAIYVDTVLKLAYDDGNGKDKKTNILDFKYERAIINKKDGSIASKQFEIKAPLLSLVPVPAFMMEELTVDFEMEVKENTYQEDKTHADVNTRVKFNSWWGLDAEITGNVSSDSEHKRTTDNSATYKIHAKAAQQPPAEGMAKLTALFAQAMEPLDLTSNPPNP